MDLGVIYNFPLTSLELVSMKSRLFVVILTLVPTR